MNKIRFKKEGLKLNTHITELKKIKNLINYNLCFQK